MNSPNPQRPFCSVPRAQRGVALFVGLIFLIVLSLVAVIAMQSTFLEMRMSTNVARHEEAFQMSESMRTLVDPFLDQNMFNTGWPVSWGGDVPDADFDFSALNAAQVALFQSSITKVGGVPKKLYLQLDSPDASGTAGTTEDPNNPSTWVTDIAFSQANPNGVGNIAANISIVPDGTVLNQGAGSAQSAGYRGLGVSSASGGASRYFEMQSVGLSPSDASNGRAVTIAQYRAVLK